MYLQSVSLRWVESSHSTKPSKRSDPIPLVGLKKKRSNIIMEWHWWWARGKEYKKEVYIYILYVYTLYYFPPSYSSTSSSSSHSFFEIKNINKNIQLKIFYSTWSLFSSLHKILYGSYIHCDVEHCTMVIHIYML